MELNDSSRKTRFKGARPRPRRLSQLFREIAETADGPISIGELLDAMGDRSFAALLIFFSAINLLPWPPGATLILGAPLVLIAGQMTWGARRAWLPRPIRAKTFTAEQFRKAIDRIAPRLEQLETFVKPRYWPFWHTQGERIVGFIALFLALVVTAPIPLGNWLPAFAIVLLALALTERDGLLFWMAMAVGALAVLVVALVLGSAAFLINFLWAQSGA
ncbi:MAG: exopolysaccharide biosynthesis protein [Rhizobiaceae bacterium]|nr:exopolysaccharide biosynthesis protein [Rhizobiaceae bacterium]MCV0407751.1 exopolysaccharide biosynthesis protein [Rhizobiaceae bacterium]